MTLFVLIMFYISLILLVIAAVLAGLGLVQEERRGVWVPVATIGALLLIGAATTAIASGLNLASITILHLSSRKEQDHD